MITKIKILKGYSKDFSGTYQGAEDTLAQAKSKAQKLKKMGIYKEVKIMPFQSYGDKRPSHYDIYTKK